MTDELTPTIRRYSPAELRSIADLVYSDEPTDLGGELRDGAAELRSIADRLDNGETVTIDRPAYRTVFASN